MSRNCFALLSVVLLLLAAPARQALAQNQHEMTQGAAKDFEKADAELNRDYKKAMDTLDDEGKTKLTKAQRAWLAFRDAQATLESDEMRGGSAEPMLYYAAQAKLTRDRIATLRAFCEEKKRE